MTGFFVKTNLENITQNIDKNHKKTISNLQDELLSQKEARNEDRFIFTLIIVVLLNVIFFMPLSTWSAPIIISFFEFFLLILYAKKMGMQEIYTLLDRILNKIIDRSKN